MDIENIQKNKQVVRFRAPRGLAVPAHFNESKAEIFVKICQVAEWINFSDLYAVEFLVDALFTRFELKEIAEIHKDNEDWANYNKFLAHAGRETDRAMKLLNSLGMTPKTCPKFVSHGPSQKKLIGIVEGGI